MTAATAKPRVVHSEIVSNLDEATLTRVLRATTKAGLAIRNIEIESGVLNIWAAEKPTGDFLSITQACALGNFGRSKAYQLIADGTLRVRKSGGKTLVEKASVDEFLAKLPEGVSNGTHVKAKPARRRRRK